MALPNAFSNQSNSTGPQLDENFAALGALTVIPCTIAGTDDLTLTPAADTPLIPAYTNYMQFSGVIIADNTGPGTVAVGSLASLPVYKDSAAGPVALTGGEQLEGNMCTWIYDSALNSGSGGFHLVFSTEASFLPLSGGTLTGPLVGTTITANFFAGANASASASITTIFGSLASVVALDVGASASPLTRIRSTLTSVTFTVTPANATQDQPILLAAAAVNDSVAIGLPSIAAALFAGAGFVGYIAAAGTVNLRLVNASTVSISAATITVRATAMGFT